MMNNRAEVKDMCLTEYDEEQAHEWFREEGREEGIAAVHKMFTKIVSTHT